MSLHLYDSFRTSVTLSLELSSAAQVFCVLDGRTVDRATRIPDPYGRNFISEWECILPALAPGPYSLYIGTLSEDRGVYGRGGGDRSAYGGLEGSGNGKWNGNVNENEREIGRGDWGASRDGQLTSEIGGVLVDVTCLLTPRIFTASLQPTAQDGTHTIHFTGLYLYPSIPLNFLLMVDNQIVKGGIISSQSPGSRDHLTFTIDPVVPGVKNISVYLDDMLLMSLRACLTRAILLSGGAIDVKSGSDGACVEPPPVVVPARMIHSQIEYALPQVGLSRGNTSVEVHAQGILLSGVYYCRFGDAGSVPGIVITANRLLCISPPSRPYPLGISLSVYNTRGDTWCCAEYRIYPVIRAVALTPELIDAAGDTDVLVTLQYVPDTELFCYFSGVYKVQAIRINPRTLSCKSPRFLLTGDTTTVEIGNPSVQE